MTGTSLQREPRYLSCHFPRQSEFFVMSRFPSANPFKIFLVPILESAPFPLLGKCLERLSPGLDSRQREYLDSLLNSAGKPGWAACRILLRLALWKQLRLKILSNVAGLPCLANGDQISFSHGESLSICLYGGAASGRLAIDAENVFSDSENAPIKNFISRLVCKPAACAELDNSTLTRLWTILEAFYKFLPDKMLFSALAARNFRTMALERRGQLQTGVQVCHYITIALRGHWLAIVGEAPAISREKNYDCHWLDPFHGFGPGL